MNVRSNKYNDVYLDAENVKGFVDVDPPRYLTFNGEIISPIAENILLQEKILCISNSKKGGDYMKNLRENAIFGMEMVREALKVSGDTVTISGVEIPRKSAEYLYDQLNELTNSKDKFDTKAIPIKLLSADRFWRSIQIEVQNRV